MKRTQSKIDKVRNCPYFQKAIELQNMPVEVYSKKWWHKCNGGTARLWLAYKSAYKHAKCFKQEGKVNIGFYEFSYSLRIGLSPYLYDKGLVCEIHINSPYRYPKDLYYTEWQKIPLTGNETDLDKTVYNHLLKYFWSDGMLETIQYDRNCTKEYAMIIFKTYIQKKMFINHGEISEEKVKYWILKKFNIESYVSLESTVKIVNQIGKQETTKKIQQMDFSFMYDFDGDIDELEDLIYENNPYNKNVFYV